MAGVLGAGNSTTKLRLVNLANVIMSELYQHVITRLQTVVDLVPTALGKIRAAATPSLCHIHHRNLLLVEHIVGHCTPAPHIVLFFVFVFYRTVAGNPNHRLAVRAVNLMMRQFYVLHHGLQRLKHRITAVPQSFCSRTSIHLSTKFACVDVVAKEVVFLLPLAEAIQLLT